MYQHEQANIIKNTEAPMMCNDRRCVMCIRVLRIFGVWSNSHRNNIPIIQDIYIYKRFIDIQIWCRFKKGIS